MEERYDPMEWKYDRMEWKYDRMEERYDPMEHGYDPMECKWRLDCIFVQNAPPYKTKRILVVVVKWHHHANGLLRVKLQIQINIHIQYITKKPTIRMSWTLKSDKNVLVISYNVIWDYFVLLPSLVKVMARVTLKMIHIALLIYKGWLVFPNFHLISSWSFVLCTPGGYLHWSPSCLRTASEDFWSLKGSTILIGASCFLSICAAV